MNSKKGIAVPFALLFAVVASVYLFSLLFSRTEVRKQGMANLNQKQAYYMAMGGIQQALLKVRLLHREAYDAGSLARGICPFFNPYGDNLVSTDLTGSTKTAKAMQFFLSDLNSGHVPIEILQEGEPEFKLVEDPEFKWEFEVTDLEVSTYYTSDLDGSVKEVVKVTAIGSAYDPRGSKTGRKEKVTKKIELHRKIN
ncbi:MAG: hypothetical protein Kow0029_06460 [Candidatus Rifleibacteriota bacterium]